jgi:hypothetical protein
MWKIDPKEKLIQKYKQIILRERERERERRETENMLAIVELSEGTGGKKRKRE